MKFSDWCDHKSESCGNGHTYSVCSEKPDCNGVQLVATLIPGHYLSPNFLEDIFRVLGKDGVANKLASILPTDSKIKSGDLGEILATEWINTEVDEYNVPIKKLRWKDSLNMAMRGEDAIGISINEKTQNISFIKVEAKSRRQADISTIREARVGLDKDAGLPTAHAITFISFRLYEQDPNSLESALFLKLVYSNIRPESVSHLLFVFSGNSLEKQFADSLPEYAGTFKQAYVNLSVNNHPGFIQDVYDLVVQNAQV